ncbi:RNA polymerase sigma factor [Fimbriiglobus ruber]|uniref:Putative RNA polymerase ECF-type sigma factor n=1 Tax=Fimbriiglobus ruber TaxID=1908690 RepID=A0A225DKA0_9BACT|nr:sigma-70 family RNA polymerase sigma factor [Fimbriiglobus ruber]OWK41900.1 putative RNA polymerase ECF-type sigma factor [Fimbriiglobus ruber]
MSSESDRLLVQQIRAGGGRVNAAWEELVVRYEGRLRAYARRRLRDHMVADDVVQDTFIGFLNSLSAFDEQRGLQSWLFTIAAHKVTDQLRKMGRTPYQPGSDADEEMLGRAADGRQRPASSLARSKERLELETAAVARALRDLIRGLQQKGDYTRIQVLELLFVKTWPNWQVAEFLNVSEQQVANYRYAAVQKLCESMRGANLSSDVFPDLK